MTDLQRTDERTPTGMELLARLTKSVTDPQAAVEIAKQIVELQVKQESLRQSRDRFEWEKLDREAKVAFAQAFERFKAGAPKILKTKHVHFESKKQDAPATSYWHVELDKACDLLIPALLKEGLTHRWKSADLPGGMTRVTCFIRHRLGYEEEGASLAGPSDQSGGKNPIQGVGSSTTYLERYTFLATCGIVPTGQDTDGIIPPSLPGLDEHLDHIGLADSVDELQRVYFKARDAAIDAQDKAAEKALAHAKNERFKELKRRDK